MSIFPASFQMVRFLPLTRFFSSTARCLVPPSKEIAELLSRRPLPYYLRFRTEQEPLVMKDYPAASQKERVKIIRKKWDSLPPEERQELKDVSKREIKEWWREMDNVDGAKTKLFLSQTESKVTRMYAKVKKIKKELEKHFGKPDKPSAVLFLYYKDVGDEVRRDLFQKYNKMPVAREIFMSSGKRWRNETPQLRQHYQDQYREKMKKYRIEVAEWEEKMKGNRNIENVNKLMKRAEALMSAETGRPKKPKRSYGLFIEEHYDEFRSKMMETKNTNEILVAMREPWAKDANIRQRYADVNKELKAKYKEDLDKWLEGVGLDKLSKTLAILNEIVDTANRLLNEDPK